MGTARSVNMVGKDLVSRSRPVQEIGDHWGLERAYVNLTDALTMLGRPTEAARVEQAGMDALHQSSFRRLN